MKQEERSPTKGIIRHHGLLVRIDCNGEMGRFKRLGSFRWTVFVKYYTDGKILSRERFCLPDF